MGFGLWQGATAGADEEGSLRKAPLQERLRHVLATVCVAAGLLTAAHIAQGLYAEAARKDLPETETAEVPLGSFASGDLVARLSVARLGLDVPVREGIQSDVLARSAGHIPGTALPGESGARGSMIAIPRSARWEDAQELRLGDRIEIKTPFGARTYCVVERRVLNPEEIRTSAFEKRKGKASRVTFIMAYPADTLGPAPQRLAVVAEAV